MKNLPNSEINRQSWPIKALAAVVVIGMTGTIVQAANVERKPIGDLEIYSPAKQGTATIFMMLDTSGSMGDGFIKDDYNKATGLDFTNCKANDVTSEKIRAVVYERKYKTTITGDLFRDEDGRLVQIKDLDKIPKEIEFTPSGCTVSGVTKYSRLVRLQIALIELLADDVFKVDNSLKNTGSLQDDYEIGLGNYSYNGNAKSGVTLVPTKALGTEQRVELIEKTKALIAKGGTPTAHALAESGAYMMGTTTDTDGYVNVVAQREYLYSSKNKLTNYYRKCNSSASTLSLDEYTKKYVYACSSWGDWTTTSFSSSIYNSYVDTGAGFGTTTSTIGRNYYKSSTNADSGFIDSELTTKRGALNRYLSPLNPKECSGNGIYILTDGEPNNSSNDRAKAVMNASLEYNPALSVSSCNSLTGGSSDGAWGCMAEYAALLRNTTNNPLKLPIKTATVGFGKDFAGLTGKKEIIVNGKIKEVIDCDSGPTSGTGKVNQNTRNLCKLGERKADAESKTFGDGGFYYTEESEDIANSIVDFASGLVQIINTAPSGTITIPDDPYRTANQLAYAYLPMLDPDIASASSIWDGNLKKYKLNQGTLFGNNSKLLYKDVAGNLDKETQDVWQSSDFKVDGVTANNDINAGGVYAKLKAPNSGFSSLRTIYVEDYTSSGNKTPTLRKVSVDTNGKPQGFDQLIDTDTYTELNKRRLLSFLGFDVVLTDNGEETEVEKIKLTQPTNEVKVLGGVVHSKPAAISYSATLDDNGRITNTREDYVLFGSMDGAVHLVDADKGEETYAIIPKKMLQDQPTALVDNSIKAKVGEPYFGVDAPWLVVTDYTYDLKGKKVKVDAASNKGKGMFAYGGLRMGGEAFYGVDITDKASPKVLFTVTPEGLNNIKSNNFTRLGQIWSKPTAAKIRRTKDAEPINVLIFGGGYDMKYENDEYTATTAEPAKGNAVYMVNANDGTLIWSASGSSVDTETADMIHSITGEITALDRDNDGLMDHIYAADLGGQIFRADFENARPAKFGFEAVNNFSSKGITRILDSKPSGKPAYRFYERPIVSFYRNQSTGTNNGKLFALINVISGNRSAPLSTLRSDNSYANRLYGIIDNDITNADLYKSGFTASVKDLNESKLTNLATTLGNAADEAAKIAAKSAMVEGTKQGWYYPLTRFDGYNNVRYNKGIGDSVVINNLLYTTVYNPDKLYGTVSSCSAKISGGSERQLYCLPYGVCMEASSKTGTGGYLPAGQGIQELTLGAYNANNTDLKVLIGNTTIAERALESNRTGYGEDALKNNSNIKDLYPGEKVRPTQVGGDGTAGEYIFNERYTMQPRVWYERK